MKKVCATLIGLVLSLTGYSQSCLPEGIVFHYQSEIDNFQTNYPGCTEIEGDVVIGPAPYLYNLNGLSVLTSIGGGLRMFYNTELVSLSGLQNITSIGGWLFVEENDVLTSLEGLENLDTIGGDLILQFNQSLTNIEALSGVNYLGGDVLIEGNYWLPNLIGLDNISVIEGSLSIIHNLNLSSLTGLEGITSIGEYVEIQRNNFLVSLAGLANLTSIGSDLRIGTGFGGNHALINLVGLANLHLIGGNLWIIDNLSLTDLTGLDSLISIGGSIEVEENTSLTSLIGIDNIAAGTITDIQIINNDTLATCDVQSICDYLVSPNGTIEIHDNATGCNSQQEVEAACGVGINDNSTQANHITIYPNPSSTTITIALPSTTIVDNTTLSIYNVNSRQVISCRITEPLTVIDISTLPRGVYFARIITDRMVMMNKFIKQ